ncbi:MAG: threonine/serine exporter family protein [Clostridiaceae bacterium]
MILNSFYAFMASMAFALLFNVKGIKVFYASLGGGIGWLLYLTLISQGLSTIPSLFFASMAVSAYSEIMARTIKSPVTTFIVASLIPLVPGEGMYNTMFQYVKGDVSGSLNAGYITLSSAGSIAVAVVLVSSIFRVFFQTYNVKRIKNR